MDGAFVIEFIKQRMRDMGIHDYTFRSVRVWPSSIGKSGTDYTISASNEYYYLVSPSVPASLTIVSDTEVFDEGADYANFQFYGVSEHTGNIRMRVDAPDEIDLEFIHVIPRYHRDSNIPQEAKN